jgi:protoheme IX farnesyltransferase
MVTAAIRLSGEKEKVLSLNERLNAIIELTKLRITIFVTLTTMFGFICYAGKLSMGIIAPAVGILLLSSGSAVINHYQERGTDALMKRTRNRPIPSGKISAQNALVIALLLIISGSIVLFLGAGYLALSIGLLNLLWYNSVYTPLKKRSALAIIPGSLVGALPPMVGWIAAGGNIFDPQIIILGFFFFIWQIPHFWLLLFIFGKDYEQAGFPTLTQIFNMQQLSRITFVWIAATFVASTLLPLFGLIKNNIIFAGMLISGIWLMWNAFRLLKPAKENISFKLAFRGINIFAIVIVLLLSIEKLFIQH